MHVDVWKREKYVQFPDTIKREHARNFVSCAHPPSQQNALCMNGFSGKIVTINSSHTAHHAKTVKHGYLPDDAQQDSKLEAVSPGVYRAVHQCCERRCSRGLCSNSMH